MAGIKKQSELAKRLRKCNVIFWDECTMTHKKVVEAVNASLQDIRNEDSKPMGGILLVLAGDFRQTLPIIPKGTAADQIDACIKRSFLWSTVKTISLKNNMRVQSNNDSSASHFAEQLLKIGNGVYPVDRDGNIKIEKTICKTAHSKEELIDFIFPEIGTRYTQETWLTERAILAPLNRNVDEINTICQSKIPGKVCKSFCLLTIIFKRCR